MHAPLSLPSLQRFSAAGEHFTGTGFATIEPCVAPRHEHAHADVSAYTQPIEHVIPAMMIFMVERKGLGSPVRT